MNLQVVRLLRIFGRTARGPNLVRRVRVLSLEALERRDVPSTTVTVGGKANIYGAGLTTAPSPGGGGGGVLPVLVNLSTLGNPARVEFPTVTGSVSGFVGSGSFNGPDGGNFFGGKTIVPAFKGISGIRNDNGVMFLAGVFIGASGQPATAPATLNVSTANTNTTVSPLLGQQFFIGNGKTSTSVLQNAVVPAGATKLYLGFAEGFGFGQGNQPGYYDDNGGSFSVTVDAAPYGTTTGGGNDASVPYSPAAQPVVLTATVDGPSGPVSEGTVTFTVFNGTTPVGTATAGAVTNGTATVTYTLPAGTATGTYSIQAVYGGTPSFAASSWATTHTLTVLPGPFSQILVQSGGGQSATVGTAFGQAITVLAADQYGNGIPGVAVTVTSPATGAGATFSTTAVTDATGVTTFTATANGTVGAYTVTVTAGGVAQTFTLTNTAGPPAGVTVTAGGGQTIAAGGTFGAISVFVVDGFGNPVGGTAVTLTSTPLGITLPTGLTTAADGSLSFTPVATGTAGTFTITVTAGSFSTAVTLTVTVGPPDSFVVAGGGGQSVAVNAGFALPVQVILVDAFGNPVVGQPVTVTGPASGAGATFSNPGLTDALGYVSFTVTANAFAGAYTILVSSGSVSVTVPLTNLATALAGVTVTTGGGQTATVGTPFAVPVVFTVVDALGNPGDPTAVTVTVPSTGPSATIGPVTATGVPGQGQVVLTANGGVGTYTIILHAGSATAPLTATNAAVPVVPPPPPPPTTVPPVALRGTADFAAGADVGRETVTLYDKTGAARYTADPFPGFTGGSRVATADFNGDGVADLIAGTGPGAATSVRVFDGVTGAELFAVAPFEASFTGGVYVTAGDLNGDGVPDLVITPDEGGGPRVDIYSGKGFGKFASFFGIDDPNFRGGARAATGDISGDGRADLIVVAGFGGGPRVAGFDGTTVPGNAPTRIFGDFFAFEQTLRNGIFVTVGDTDGDGRADLICGGGPGGGPRVTVFSGKALLANTYDVTANFFAGDVASRGGIRLAVKDLDGDAKADLVAGAGAAAGSRVTAYFGKDVPAAGPPGEAFAFDAFAGFTGGVFVG